MKSSKKLFDKDPTDVEVYLKHQIGQLNLHKNKIMEKINLLCDMNQDGFYLRQELNKRNEQLFEIKSSVSDLQFALMQQQDQNLSLLKENDQLRLRLLDYQKKVQILMAYANVPDDFPILSLVTSTEPNSVVVERQLPRKQESKPGMKLNSAHNYVNSTNFSKCNKCGKYINKTETPLDSDEEICKQKSCKHHSINPQPLLETFRSKYASRENHTKENTPKESSSDAIADIDQANLIIQSLKSQLHEIKYNYDKHIDLLVQDMKLQREEHKSHLDSYSDDCSYYNTYVKNLHGVLYKYLYEDVCSQQMDTSYLGDLYKYAVCVDKCRQLLGDKFPLCIKQYLDTSSEMIPHPSDHLSESSHKIDLLTKQVNKLKQHNVHLELELSSQKLRQQENLLNMNQRVELYQRKHDEMLERKNRECKAYRKQIDALVEEVNELKE